MRSREESLLEFVQNLRDMDGGEHDKEILADVRGDHCQELIAAAIRAVDRRGKYGEAVEVCEKIHAWMAECWGSDVRIDGSNLQIGGLNTMLEAVMAGADKPDRQTRKTTRQDLDELLQLAYDQLKECADYLHHDSQVCKNTEHVMETIVKTMEAPRNDSSDAAS